MGEAKRRRAILACDARQRACGWDADGAPTNEHPLERRRQPWILAGRRPPEPERAPPPPAPALATYVGLHPHGLLARVGDVVLVASEEGCGYMVLSSEDESVIPPGTRIRFAGADTVNYRYDRALQRSAGVQADLARRRADATLRIARKLPLAVTLAILLSGSDDGSNHGLLPTTSSLAVRSSYAAVLSP